VEYEKKKQELAKKVEAIFFRVKQSEERPKAVKRLQSDINKTLVSLPKWEKDKPQITASEREEVLNITQKIQVWLEEKLEAQANIPSHETPAFTVKELKIKQTPMKALVSRLTKYVDRLVCAVTPPFSRFDRSAGALSRSLRQSLR
jgi:hypothetical protein